MSEIASGGDSSGPTDNDGAEPERESGPAAGAASSTTDDYIPIPEFADADFAPEPFTPHYVRGLFQAMRNLTRRNLHLLGKRLAVVPENSRPAGASLHADDQPARAARVTMLPDVDPLPRAERKLAVVINRPFRRGALFDRVAKTPLPAWAADMTSANRH